MRKTALLALMILSASTPVNAASIDADIDKACKVIANFVEQTATNRLRGVTKTEALSRVPSEAKNEIQDIFLAAIDGVYEPETPPNPKTVGREAYNGCVEGFSGEARSVNKARHEVVLKCSLVYGALFMSSRKAQHTKLLSYSQARVRVIAPELQSYKGNPDIERDFKRIAQENRALIDHLEHDFYDAIIARDHSKFRSALREVSDCDRQLRIGESPLPSL